MCRNPHTRWKNICNTHFLFPLTQQGVDFRYTQAQMYMIGYGGGGGGSTAAPAHTFVHTSGKMKKCCVAAAAAAAGTSKQSRTRAWYKIEKESSVEFTVACDFTTCGIILLHGNRDEIYF